MPLPPQVPPPIASSSEGEQEALEREADDLLKSSLKSLGRGPHPFYTEHWLREVRRREERSGAETTAPGARRSPHPAALLPLVIARTPLRPHEKQVLYLASQGLNLSQIAGRLARPPTTIRRWFGKGLAAVRSHWEEILCLSRADALVRETYREQLNATVHHEERHCAPGREECRHDGLCKQRWYLYYGN